MEIKLMSWGATFREGSTGPETSFNNARHSRTDRTRPAPPLGAMEGQDASPILYVNGKRHVMPEGKAEQTLLAYLRGGCLPKLDSRKYTSPNVTALAARPRVRPRASPTHPEPPTSIRTQASG